MRRRFAEATATVIDSSCLIHLWKLDLIRELSVLYSRVYIPLYVIEEVQRKGRSKRKLRELIRDFDPLLQKCDLGNSYDAQFLYDRQLNPVARIGRGESEVIVQARERQISTVLIDDRRGKQTASQHTLRAVDLLDILGSLRRNGLIDDITPLINRLGKSYTPNKTKLKSILKELDQR